MSVKRGSALHELFGTLSHEPSDCIVLDLCWMFVPLMKCNKLVEPTPQLHIQYGHAVGGNYMVKPNFV